MTVRHAESTCEFQECHREHSKGEIPAALYLGPAGNRIPYLAASLAHVKAAFAARGSELESIESTRLAIRSMLDMTTNIPFEALQVLADKLMVLPSLVELPSDLKAFLSETRWPQEIKPIKPRRVYGIEWIAAVATITAALVGFVTSVVQASGTAPLTEAILSPLTVYFLVAIVLSVGVFIYLLRSTQPSVEISDINAFEKDIILRAGDLIGKRTSLRTMILIPETLLAAGSAILAFVSGLFLLGAVLEAMFYPNFLSNFPPVIFGVSFFFLVVFFLLTYVLARDIWREFRSKTKKTDTSASTSSPPQGAG